MFRKFVEKNKEVTLLFLISLLFLYPIFKGGFFLAHDSITHNARTAFYEIDFKDHQLPPRWAEGANSGFGSPFMIFYYPLASYLMVPVHLLGISFDNTYLIFNSVLFFLTPIGFYLWTRKNFSKKVAMASSIFYTSLPYHFLIVYVRGAPGETLAFTILPFIFWSIEKLREKQNLTNILLLSVLYASFVLSHNGISLIFSPILLIYAIIRGRKAFLFSITSIFFGLIISAYFWYPALVENKYTNYFFYFGEYYKDHFAPLISTIYSAWGFGTEVNKSGGLSPQVGVPAFLVFGGGVLLLIKSIKKKPFLLSLWILIFLLGIFLSTSLSVPVWQRVDFLKRFEFPWRFMALSAFAAAALSPYVLEKIKNVRVLFLICLLIVLYSLPFLNVQKYISLPDSYYYNYTGSTYFHNEATTLWSAGDPSKKAKEQIEFIEGGGKIQNLLKRTYVHKFDVIADKDSKLVDNTVFFPGWLVWVDGSQTPIQFQDINYRGLITFSVPKGHHSVYLRFVETRERKEGDVLTLLGLAAFGFLSLMIILRKVKIIKLPPFFE